MSTIGRRRFCALLGAGLAGVATGCAGSSERATSTGASDDALLAGVSFEVRRDPG